jgi:hypothetical protein
MPNSKLKHVQEDKPPYSLNEFPKNLPADLWREVIYQLATREIPRIEGSDWAEIFARLIAGRRKQSSVGFDDVVLEQTAWSVKSVEHDNPSEAKRVRLISGRNSPVYSFGDKQITEVDPNELGEKILSIWNERVAAVKKNYLHMRTVVLLKSEDLLELALFEFDTEIYPAENFSWVWNQRGNLEGMDKRDAHRFTWQPHGSQFTIVEDVPDDRLAIRIKAPALMSREQVTSALGFDNSWVEIL